MPPLSTELRNRLANVIQAARRESETGARKSLEALGVQHHEPYGSLSPDERTLRQRLRAHGRQLGDARDRTRGTQEIDHLMHEVAYEHWHRMLFARFLAENHLLIEPDSGVAISLADCRDLASERSQDPWSLAGHFAQRMLPRVFRLDDPALEVPLAPETRQALERHLESLPTEVFVADDALGWTYQFWQAEKKNEINASGVKIGGDELPAVTQLFTEHYMVLFLLHNTIGAWHAGKYLAENPELVNNATSEDDIRTALRLRSSGGYEFTYLRFVRTLLDVDKDGPPTGPWRPAAGCFQRWPRIAKELRVLDPCCGSGHFLIEAFQLLVRLRMDEELLALEDAIDAVLRENLFGLELDSRCTQIAAFNVALAAWRIAGRPFELPALHIACSGLAPHATKDDWLALTGQALAGSGVRVRQDLFGADDNLFSASSRASLSELHDLFERAPELGSLIDPRRLRRDLHYSGYSGVEPLLAAFLAHERANVEQAERAVAAQGMARAAAILADTYTLVVTNVPFLGRGKHAPQLKSYCERVYPDARADLATCFVERCLSFCSVNGTAALVTPQNWWFHASSEDFRARILSSKTLRFLATLGEEAWQSFGNRGPVAVLMVIDNCAAPESHCMFGVDALPCATIALKVATLTTGTVVKLTQSGQYGNPNHRITISEGVRGPLLEAFADSHLGLGTGDAPHYTRCFWELARLGNDWSTLQAAPSGDLSTAGREHVVAWDSSARRVRGMSDDERRQGHNQDYRGRSAWGRKGVAVSLMRTLRATSYDGDLFEKSIAVLIPKQADSLLAIKAFTDSSNFSQAVRRIDRKVMVTNATLVKVPFDLAHWQDVAFEKYPYGLPAPHSSDPSQWLFCGHPQGSSQPLQVAVARLLGYRWPRQTGTEFADCDALDFDGLEPHAHTDGILCFTPLRGELSLFNALRRLLASAFGSNWSAEKERELLADTPGNGGAVLSLEEWLRDRFFEEHCKLFHNRPFIWHVWDGRHDGFHALVNCHRLTGPGGEGRRTLEALTYSYLGDWIARQEAAQREGRDGADARLAASQDLYAQLERILAGEPPFDLFVRWKPLHRQPIGWDPDIDDGVRQNLRPFLIAELRTAGRKGAGILRWKPTLNWEQADRGNEPESVRPKEDFPWFWSCPGKGALAARTNFMGDSTFDGNRWNNLHYSNDVKLAARERVAKDGGS